MRTPEFDRERIRLLSIFGGGFVGLEVLAFVIAQVLVGGNPAPARSAAIAQLKPFTSGVVVLAPDAKPTLLHHPLGMGSFHAGVAVKALSDVDQVQTRSGLRRAPDGSTLLAFRLGDWTCETTPCESWESLTPKLVVNGTTTPLPDGGNTFVVVVGPGVEDVAVTIDADGFGQSVSLFNDSVGQNNILLLGQPGREKQLALNKALRLTEHTSIGLQSSTGTVANTFERDFTVEYAERRFFFNGAVPSGPRKAFLVVNTYFSYPGQTQRYVPLDEVTFVDRNGIRYAGRDVDPDPAVALLGFEIPADITGGTLVIGGTTDKTSTNGTPYTSTLAVAKVPITFS